MELVDVVRESPGVLDRCAGVRMEAATFAKDSVRDYPDVRALPRADRPGRHRGAEHRVAGLALAQRAEECGYAPVWYAEHQDMPSIASSATGVVTAHVGAQTTSIRLGAGGAMLPNHTPLVIAEQFGTREAMSSRTRMASTRSFPRRTGP